MSRRYSCWGFTLESEFSCPWLLETAAAPDVFLHLGPTPTSLQDPAISGLRYQAKPGELLLWLDDLARFHVVGGTDITVELWGNLEELHVFLLGSAMGALLYQRGLLPLHGSVVAFGDKAYGFLGPSGIGKSTLAAALCQRGGRLVGDDICALRADHDGIRVLPGYPKQNLWPDSLQRLGEQGDEIPRLRPCLDKRVRAATAFEGAELALAGAFALDVSDRPVIQVKRLEGRERFFMLERNLYRPHFARGLLGQAGLFAAMAPMVPRLPLSHVTRPRHGFQLDELGAAILQIIEAEPSGVGTP